MLVWNAAKATSYWSKHWSNEPPGAAVWGLIPEVTATEMVLGAPRALLTCRLFSLSPRYLSCLSKYQKLETSLIRITISALPPFAGWSLCSAPSQHIISARAGALFTAHSTGGCVWQSLGQTEPYPTPRNCNLTLDRWSTNCTGSLALSTSCWFTIQWCNFY